MSQTSETLTASPQYESRSGLAGVWDSLLEMKIGPLPVPYYALALGIVYWASLVQKLPADMIGGFAAIMVMGWLLGDIGKRIPVVKDIGGPAIFALFVPSIMVFYGWLNKDLLNAITAVMKTSNFLYLYISCLVCGSILGMPRKILIQGFLRMFVPLIIGEIAAISLGCAVGMLFGYDLKRVFFYILVPIMGGGIGEGILPYSLGMSQILNQPQSSIIPLLVPAAMLGNVTAIISAGLLRKLGEKKPQFSGNGLLVKTADDRLLQAEMNKERKLDLSLMGGGFITACCFFVFGGLMSVYVGIPGAILMIFTAAIAKCLKLFPAKMEEGAFMIYKFIATNFTYPLMVGLGVLYMSFGDVIAQLSPTYLLICMSAVCAQVVSAFFVGKALKMYPVETAIVTCCNSGLGGTGDVAILTASNRLELMPFAQVATRLGGAWMVVMATLLLKTFS